MGGFFFSWYIVHYIIKYSPPNDGVNKRERDEQLRVG